MNPTAIRTIYKAFGLTIASEIALPELLRETDKPATRMFISSKEDLSQAGTSEAAATIIMRSTRRIHAEHRRHGHLQRTWRKPDQLLACSRCRRTAVRLYLLGTCMGALLFQRKLLPLHGSAVVINGKAYAFVGDSGAGKSTLAAAFSKARLSAADRRCHCRNA